MNRLEKNPLPEQNAAMVQEATTKMVDLIEQVVDKPDKVDAAIVGVAMGDSSKTEVLMVGDISILLRLFDMCILGALKQLGTDHELSKQQIEDVALRMTYLAKSRFINEDEFAETSEKILPGVIDSIIKLTAQNEVAKDRLIEMAKHIIAGGETPTAPKLEPEIDKAAPRSFPKPPKF